MRRRGAALISVLAVGALVLLFGFTMVGVATTHYRVASSRVDALAAREAAEAGVEDALYELGEDVDFGQGGQELTRTLSNGASYLVTFDASSPLASTNNLNGITTRPGSGGRAVPPHSVHVVARGTSSNGRTRVLECVAQLSATPFALAGSGSVAADTAVVAAVPSLADLAGSELPAHVYGGDVDLTGLSVISGDVRSPGTINTGAGVIVAGSVEPGDTVQDLPDLDIADYNNQTTPGVEVLPGGSYGLLPPVTIGGGLPLPGQHVLRGAVYIDGSVNFTGNVLLDNAYVYVAGDFEANGIVTGTGTVFVDGSSTFLGAAMLDQDGRIAMFAEGDLSIPLGSFFQGSLYSRSNITAGPLLQVVGPVIANHRPGDPPATVNLGTGAKITLIPEYLAFASYYLARSSGAGFKRVYWGERND